jgi:hypothetical protein
MTTTALSPKRTVMDRQVFLWLGFIFDQDFLLTSQTFKRATTPL